MKKFIKKISISLVVILLFSSFTFISYAEQPPNSIYEETYEQISAKNLELTSNGEDISVNVSDCNFISRLVAKNRKKDLETFLEEYPEFEQTIAQKITENHTICEVAYTKAPIYLDESGNWQRVKKSVSSHFC